MTNFKYCYSYLIILFSVFIFSCSSPKELRYLQTGIDTTTIGNIALTGTTIEKGDILGIAVFSDNASSTLPFNQLSQNATSSSVSGENMVSATRLQMPQYLVDIEGNIAFPVIGKLKVEGLTKLQLVSLLDQKLTKFLSNPYYDIRFVNFKITLIGEVAKPGTYSIPNERVTILEAIGMAGDLTFFGKRDNVLIIREKNGKREFGRIDLRDSNLFKSEFYYLQQNDMVVVDMSKRKVAANDQVAFRNISLAATIVSAIAVLVSVLR